LKREEYIVNPGYYHFCEDLKKYPDAWCYVAWSSRGQGKTYGALWYAYCEGFPIVYMKRTKNDVNLICNENKIGFDASPYVPINRDHDIGVKAKRIEDGVGGFYVEGEPRPISYVIALSAAKSLKGFDLSNCEWLVFDEFIPQVGEITRKREGDMILDLYMTIRRDREQRGRKPLRLVLFANAEEISTPITNTLEVVDVMADMNARGDEYVYDDERGIMLHRIPNAHEENTEHGGIYAAMRNTAWGKKSFGAEFSNNDFSCVQTVSLKGYVPWIHLHYNMHDYYIYRKSSNGSLYMCDSKGNTQESYNLDREVEQRRFYSGAWVDIYNECIDGRMLFKRYSMYDIIMNFKSFFKTT
jgi:hypothetical protein